jgi:hypothetical protein
MATYIASLKRLGATLMVAPISNQFQTGAPVQSVVSPNHPAADERV